MSFYKSKIKLGMFARTTQITENVLFVCVVQVRKHLFLITIMSSLSSARTVKVCASTLMSATAVFMFTVMMTHDEFKECSKHCHWLYLQTLIIFFFLQAMRGEVVS